MRSVLALAVTVSLVGPATLFGATGGEDFVGPFATWLDARRDFGAVGDGKADDTAALQKALDAVGQYDKDHFQLYLPAGTYRITKRLERKNAIGVFLIGEHPSTTRLVWDGPAGVGMMWFNGRGSRFERLTFDGAGKAGAGFEFKYESRDPKDGQTSSHRLCFADVVFQDLGYGFDGGGKLGWLDSEVLMRRCKFLRCKEYGIGLRHFNACDYWIWQCEFVDCKVGVSNEPPPWGGSFCVSESLFRGSLEADATTFHSGYFAMRDNVSIGSKRFFHAKAHGSAITLQRNKIIDAKADDALLFDTDGNIHLMDNVVISRAGQTSGPVVRGRAIVSALGNTFTLAKPIQTTGRLYERDTRVVDRDTLHAALPELPGVLPRNTGPVFDVVKGADGRDVQEAIDKAAAHARKHPGTRPVVHLSLGTYRVTRTLLVPAGAPVEVAGDGVVMGPDKLRGTLLQWAGTDEVGPVVRLQGPNKAVLRDFGVVGPAPSAKYAPPRDRPPPAPITTAMEIDGCDQPGALIHLEACNMEATTGAGVLVDRLDNARVQMFGHEGRGLGDTWKREWDKVGRNDEMFPFPSVRVVGGPRTKAREATTARVDLFGCNTGRFDVRNGARLLIRDTWYENANLPFHMILTGNGRVTYDTGKDAMFTHPQQKEAGAGYVLDNFKGELTLLNIVGHFSQEHPLIGFQGDCTGAKVLALGESTGAKAGWQPDPKQTGGGKVAVINCRSGAPVPDVSADDGFVQAMLRDTREARPKPLGELPAEVTDVRMYRVHTQGARVGLLLRPQGE